ncbi:hypothetical protein CEUSTIGMA_g12080.t1 [Chlamydomonas eustigma]|uniref:TPX2 C-terminal domain-containing protein n=1 Tax=Chlamydomonas eustigma TaxID=1157962 RepID=A0A250XNZ0_9CHLO|nr:hypothetical protein CEUSTIGMA_g12080.t1 [Chlamydomonas eustigma]|eukprot:GAX84659.1 hypothetical protein CEUSTIGMA_g12080.t1 [Chlamydomonas eustigma]
MDEDYEYDAPKYYDFRRTDDGVSMASRWFDTQDGDFQGQLAALLFLMLKETTLISKAGNIVTSWGSTAAKMVLTLQGASGVLDASIKYCSPQRNRIKAERVQTNMSNTENCPPRSQPPITRSIARSKTEKAEAAKPSQTRMSDAVTSKSHGLHAKKSSSMLQMATAVKKRAVSTRRLSENRALALKIAADESHTSHAQKHCISSINSAAARANLKRVLHPRKVMPAHSTKPLTLPDEIELRTSKRARQHCAEDEAVEEEDVGQRSTPFKPLALKVREFHSKTPARFRRKPAPRPEARPLSITQAKAPTLMTSCRTRPVAFKSLEERELEELEAMPKFQATRLNPLVMLGSSQRHDTLKHAALTTTQPMPFVFVTDDRAERRRQKCGADGHQEDGFGAARFKACPLDRSILEGPVGIPSRNTQFSATVPKSPLLRTKMRRSEVHQHVYQEDNKFEFHARPIPQFLTMPREVDHVVPPPVTQPLPFKLETEKRGKAHDQAFKAQLKVEEAQAREALIPKAQLLPLSLEVPLIPNKPEPRGLTLPRPFRLRSEARHKVFVEESVKEMNREEEVRRNESEFKARPLPCLDAVFQVHESDTALTIPKEVSLATESRASERAQFDHAMELKTQAAEELRKAEETAKLERETAAVKELRRGLKIEARPVPDFSRPFMAMPSARPLTNPVTPKFGKKAKRARHV